MILIVPPAQANWNLHLVLEIRERLERRTDKDLDGNRNDNSSDLFSRWRLGAALTGPGKLEGKLEFQDAHDLQWVHGKNSSTERLDMLLGYLQAPVLGADLSGGRIRLNESNLRLLGEADWNNVTNPWTAQNGLANPLTRSTDTSHFRILQTGRCRSEEEPISSR